MTDSISNYCDENGIRLKLILPLSNDLALRTGVEVIGGYPILDIRYEPLYI